MRFTIELDTVPDSGHELASLIAQAAGNVRYNIGPEPLRATKGSIYDNPAALIERIGTWHIDLSVGSQPKSELFQQVAGMVRPPEGV